MQAPFVKESLDAAKIARKSNQKLTNKLKKRVPKNLDSTVNALHEEVFETIDCLDCGNCCKTTSPIFRNKDIDRLAKHFRIKSRQFIDDHLHLDSDGDYVLNSAPCPFLEEDNSCGVYDARPLACREYPHTDRKRMHQLLDISMNNTLVCPAVAKIYEKLQESYS